jgi:hypothetical protein
MCSDYPTNEELKKRYESLDNNKDLKSVLNWKDPSFRKEQKESDSRKRKPCNSLCGECEHIGC